MPDGSRMEVFGSGGGQAVSDSLSTALGAPVPLLGQIPLDPRLRESGDGGVPLVLSAPETAAAKALAGVANRLSTRSRGLAGMSLNISPVKH
jgi:ATP-binding protein involved in chromosome partitioning